MKCSVIQCNCEVEYVLGKFDDGVNSMLLCPNHQIMYFLGIVKLTEMELYPSKISDLSCAICGEQAIRFEDTDATYDLCGSHMIKLVRKSLSKQEFSVLYLKHGKTYLMHDDFYDYDGEALQPME